MTAPTGETKELESFHLETVKSAKYTLFENPRQNGLLKANKTLTFLIH
jgi:hypothetical protein